MKGAADQHLRVSSVLRRRFRCPRLRPSVVYGHDSLGDRRVRVGRQRFTEHLQKGSSGARWHMPDWIASPHRPGAALPAANQRPRVCRFIARACARAQYVPRPRRLANTPQVQPSGLNPLQPLQQQRRRKQHPPGNSVTGGGRHSSQCPLCPRYGTHPQRSSVPQIPGLPPAPPLPHSPLHRCHGPDCGGKSQSRPKEGDSVWGHKFLALDFLPN